MMKKFYFAFLLLAVISGSLKAQTEVMVSPGDSTLDAAVFEAAEAGTLNTTTFVLQRGGEYIIGDRINNEVDGTPYNLTIVAADGAGDRPICRPKFGNDRPFDLDGAGTTVTLRGLFITGISTEPDDIQDNHMIRLDGENMDVLIEDCHLDFNYRSAVQVRRSDGGSLTIRNSVISNILGLDTDLDDPRGVGIRLQADASVTLENTSFYNLDNSAFINESGEITSSININNCTFANIGQDGISIEDAPSATVTNSMFYNVGILGNLNGALDSVFVIQLQDSISTDYTITNNTVYVDTATYFDPLPSDRIQVKTLNSLAAAVADESTFLTEAIVFNNLPDGFDLSFMDKTGWDSTSLDADFGYSQAFLSYTGGINRTIIGDTNWEFAEVQLTDVEVAPGDSTLEAAIRSTLASGNISTTRFVLNRGGEYILPNPINNEIDDIAFDLTIEAADGTGDRPTLVPKVGNTRPLDLDGSNATVALNGLFITGISKDPEDIQDNHMIRVDGDNLVLEIDDCHIDGNYRSGIQIRNAGGFVTIMNSVISNIIGLDDTEDPRVGVGLRLQDDVTVTVQNTSFYNIGDAAFSNNEGVIEGVLSINNCTFANIGQDAVRIDEAPSATVTNSMFVNVGILGNETDSIFAIQLLDSVSTNYTITNNTIYVDTVTYLDALPNDLIQVVSLNSLTAAVADESTFLSESIEFNNLPDGYDFTTGWNATSLDGDFGYSQAFLSYTGGTNGSVIGDTTWTFEPVTVPLGLDEIATTIRIYPNPASHYISFNLNDPYGTIKNIEVFSFSGALVKKVDESAFIRNQPELRLDVTGLTRGLYFTRIQLSDGKTYSNKFILK